MNLNSLDSALHDLGMLSVITDARQDYLRETKSNFGTMRLNTRYVSNVTVGFCMKRSLYKHRMCPYVLPIRHRTKSENSDVNNSEVSENTCDVNKIIIEPSTTGCGKDISCSIKRCQSLENLNLLESQTESENFPEVDCVSTRIQQLQVAEEHSK